MTSSPLSYQQILDLIPQKDPFLFVDQIISVDENSIAGCYTYRPDAFFYVGHFPQNPITPGVILLETIAQIGIVAFGIYLLSLQTKQESAKDFLFLFSDAQVEYFKPVLPGEKVFVYAEKEAFRLKKLKAKASMQLEDGTLIATATLSGMGVSK
jgi:3-hydroxyacyl-[acyl-carrier-protein] dehydratase